MWLPVHYYFDQISGISIGFDPPYTVTEGDGSIEVCAVLISGSLERTVTLNFTLSTGDDSATSTDPVDFSAVAVDLQFDKMNTRVCIEILVTDDSIVEDRESFVLTIRSNDERLTVDNMRGTSTVLIIDNDRVEIGFERGKYLQIEEGRTIEVCAILRNTTLERVLTIRLKDNTNIIGIKLIILSITIDW